MNLRGVVGTPLPPFGLAATIRGSNAGWPSPELECEGANLSRPNPALHGFCGRLTKAPRPVRKVGAEANTVRRFIIRWPTRSGVCRACIRRATSQGTNVNIEVFDCACVCAHVPGPDEPVVSVEMCSDCGHPHAANVEVMTKNGPAPALIRLGFIPDSPGLNKRRSGRRRKIAG